MNVAFAMSVNVGHFRQALILHYRDLYLLRTGGSEGPKALYYEGLRRPFRSQASLGAAVVLSRRGTSR
jgi:hypothetical protein